MQSIILSSACLVNLSDNIRTSYLFSCLSFWVLFFFSLKFKDTFFHSPQAATPTRKIAAMPSAALPPTKRVDVPLVEEASELEELEQFAKAFKQRRIKLGFTQVPHVLCVVVMD